MRNVFIKIKNLITKVLSTLVDCIVPTLPVLIGVGMINVLLIFAGPLVLNVLSETSNTYRVLSFVADAGYYFMPIYIAVSSADVFKTNRFISALIGAMLLSPTFVSIVAANEQISVFGLPIALTNYGNQVISSIIAVWILSYIYSFLQEKITENLRAIFAPLLTILIMIPIAFCLIGPLGVFLSDNLVTFIMYLSKLGPLGNAIICAMLPYITIAGLSGANLSAMLILASSGCDPILFFSNVIYNNVLGFVTLALYLKNKKADCLAAAITSAIAGASEPALFGIVVKDFKALASFTIANFFAGLYSGIMGVKSYAMASFGIFGVITTIGPDSSILHAIISIIIGCVIGFVLTLITHRKQA